MAGGVVKPARANIGKNPTLMPPHSPATLLGDKMDIEELKPCPFCGGAVHFHGSHLGDECQGCHNIYCANCGLFDMALQDNGETLDEVRAVCATRWNRRAIVAKLEAAQSSLEEIAMLADHQIPAYAFGDNEAACDLASRMSSIYKLANFDKETA